MLGEKLVTELIRYARTVATTPSVFGEDVVSAPQGPPTEMAPYTRAAALRALSHFCHQVRASRARHLVANAVVPLLVEALILPITLALTSIVTLTLT